MSVHIGAPGPPPQTGGLQDERICFGMEHRQRSNNSIQRAGDPFAPSVYRSCEMAGKAACCGGRTLVYRPPQSNWYPEGDFLRDKFRDRLRGETPDCWQDASCLGEREWKLLECGRRKNLLACGSPSVPMNGACTTTASALRGQPCVCSPLQTALGQDPVRPGCA